MKNFSLSGEADVIKRRAGRRALCAALSAIILASPSLSPRAAAARPARELVPMGDTVGITLKLNGALVIALNSFESGDGSICPAAEAGIAPGDIITMIEGKNVDDASDIRSALDSADGSVAVEFEHLGEKRRATVEPFVNDGARCIGVLLRDSLTGMGTVTFYDPESESYAALGHAVSDIDTGVAVPIRDGSIMPAEVTGVLRGASGAPGQIKGDMDFSHRLGTVLKNTEYGISGIIGDESFTAGREALPAARDGEIETGGAEILSSVSGAVERYGIEISRVYSGGGGKYMMVRVTDERLLELTGGIVQGMSGSPIIQNGRLVGAVTHVLVNDPTRGYAISVERMLASCADGAPEQRAA